MKGDKMADQNYFEDITFDDPERVVQEVFAREEAEIKEGREPLLFEFGDPDPEIEELLRELL